jgi:Putative zinc-finger
MEDRAHIPSSPACGQWETLLADALDGQLKPEDETTFAEHMTGCKACTALFEEARRGREWLEFLSPEPEVPAGLLDKILAQTGPGQVAGYGLIAGGAKVLPMPPAWQRPGFTGKILRFAEPRLLMTAAMAFFSLALTLNLTGVRLGMLRMADLRPTAVRSFMERRLTMASVPIIRYYDHLRFVYEVESRMRELRRGSEGEGKGNDSVEPRPNDAAPAAPGESKQTPGQSPGQKDGGSRIDNSPQQSGRPAARPTKNDFNDFLETSLTFHGTSRAFRRLQNGTRGMEVRERSTVWTA